MPVRLLFALTGAALLAVPGAARAQSTQTVRDTTVVPVLLEIREATPGLVLDVTQHIHFGEVLISKSAAILCRYTLGADGSLSVGTQVRSGVEDSGAPPGCGTGGGAGTPHPATVSLACQPQAVVLFQQQVQRLDQTLGFLSVPIGFTKDDGTPLQEVSQTPQQGALQCPASGLLDLTVGASLFVPDFAASAQDVRPAQIVLSVQLQ